MIEAGAGDDDRYANNGYGSCLNNQVIADELHGVMDMTPLVVVTDLAKLILM